MSSRRRVESLLMMAILAMGRPALGGVLSARPTAGAPPSVGAADDHLRYNSEAGAAMAPQSLDFGAGNPSPSQGRVATSFGIAIEPGLFGVLGSDAAEEELADERAAEVEGALRWESGDAGRLVSLAAMSQASPTASTTGAGDVDDALLMALGAGADDEWGGPVLALEQTIEPRGASLESAVAPVLVPEPSSVVLWLLATGGAYFLMRNRRFRA